MAGLPSKTGTIAEVRPDGFQRVQCDDGTVHFLRLGLDGLTGGRVGDRVCLSYAVHGSLGTWWPERLKSDEPAGR